MSERDVHCALTGSIKNKNTKNIGEYFNKYIKMGAQMRNLNPHKRFLFSLFYSIFCFEPKQI